MTASMTINKTITGDKRQKLEYEELCPHRQEDHGRAFPVLGNDLGGRHSRLHRKRPGWH